ncbi:MAG: phospholipid carrier-dependent glycosyltransferase [Candidatus Melainabacteria bacterium]|nr:phospholipid carrier-dependent glycosyltransferase [Candidatus Melainabacteria bacterium]
MKLEKNLLFAFIIFAFIVRMVNLTYPEKITWDEIYYVVDTQKMLHNEPYFIDHPPFGRWLIALGILIWGNNAFGWRISQAIFGTLLIPVSYLIGKKIFTHKFSGLLTAFFITFELIFLTYSRMGLVDIFLIFFIASSFLLFITSCESSLNNKTAYLIYILSAIVSGLAIAVKWTGVTIFLILLFWAVFNKKPNYVNRSPINLFFIFVALLTYCLTFSFEKTNFQYFNQRYHTKISNHIEGITTWHKLAYSSHTRKNLSHSDTSKWYTWPLMYKPVWIHFKVTDRVHNKARCIATFGNPIIWWLGLLAIIIELFFLRKKKDNLSIFLLSSYFISYLPYAFIQRPMFLYHYLIALFFLILILEYTFVKLYQKFTYLQPLLQFTIISTILMFFYLYPFSNASEVTKSQYQNRLWLNSWEFTLKGWRWN